MSRARFRRSGSWVGAVAVLLSLALGRSEPAYGDPAAAARSVDHSDSRTAKQRDALKQRAERLAQAVNELDQWAKKQNGLAAVKIVRLADGKPLAEANSKVSVNPASNQKLLTAAAALHFLGPDFRFATGLYGRLRNGKIDTLVLRGNGDPSLGAPDLWRLVHAAVAVGLREVGDILVDQSRFDGEYVPPAYEQQPKEWASFRAPVSAVALESNAVTLNVVATREGEPARVFFDPPGFVIKKGSVTTKEKGSGQGVRWKLEPEGLRLKATLSGHVPEGLARLRVSRRVDDPRAYAGYVLSHMLREQGVEVHGKVGLGGERVESRLVYVTSAPLSQLLYRLGKQSDNFYAEMLFKALGAEVFGAPAKSADGARAVRQYLDSIGVDTKGLKLVNGSGLFDADRLTASVLAQVLTAAYRDPSLRSEYLSQLSIGGVDGTLRSRLRDHAEGRIVRAKTGTLRDVIALSGYALTREQPTAFAIVLTGVAGRHGEARRRIDALVDRIIKTG